MIGPYRTELVVAAECMFTWYWLADVCAAEGIAFVLGHALAMKAIHGGKAKNDKSDSHKIGRPDWSHYNSPALPGAPGSVPPIARKHFQLPSGSFFHTPSTVPRICFASPPGESTYEAVN